MFGRLLRVTSTVLVIAVAFVTPVLATSTSASADTVVNGCTVVSSPTATNFTNCPGADLSGANLAGVDLSFANLSGAVFAACTSTGSIGCAAADLSGVNLTDANVSNSIFNSCNIVAGCDDANLTAINLSGANLTDTIFASCYLLPTLIVACDAADLSGTNLSGANFSGAALGASGTSAKTNPAVAAGANLTDATLTDATLTGADLTDATFTGATLTGAALSGTILIPSGQTVSAPGGAAGALVTWPTPPSLPGATPGSCTPPSGSTFATGATIVTCQVLDDAGDVATGTFTVTVNPSPTTFVASPSDGATVAGDSWLDAGASSPDGITSVVFVLNGGVESNVIISDSTPTIYGYIGAWNSTIVNNGTYTVQSVATGTNGVSTTSAPITITVDNPAGSTSVVSPSDGATESGTSALLDASATSGVTGVSYELTGGTLTNQVVATATETFFGWAALWDTTSVPNGTYTLQSVATYSGGTVTSAPITITVTN